MRKVARFILGSALALAVVGCVQRTISITSEPEGALVYLNDQEVGRTPLTVPFTWYGTYDVRLEHEGYQPLWTKARAKAPVWEWMGPDLVAEAVPHAKSEQKWHFTLQANPPENPEALTDRANQMRAMVQKEVAATTQPSK